MQRKCLRKADLSHLRSGAAAVEMALAAPILVAIVFGIMQVGYAFNVQYSIQIAAYKACRVATLPNRTQSAVTSTVNSALQPIDLNSYATTTIQVNNVTADVSTANSGDNISVTIAIPISDATLFPGFFSNWSGNLTGAATLRCQ